MQGKRETQRDGAARNPFIDPRGYRAYLDIAEERYRAALAREDTKPGLVSPAREPGEPLLLEGRVRGADGMPIAGAIVRVFQTDARGYYTPEDERTGRLDEPNARLKATDLHDRSGRTLRVRDDPAGRLPLPPDGRS
jgi:protocatechuate 3,4-dioxygenase beta subunit